MSPNMKLTYETGLIDTRHSHQKNFISDEQHMDIIIQSKTQQSNRRPLLTLPNNSAHPH